MWKSFLMFFLLLSVVVAKAETLQFDRVNNTMQVIADFVVIGDDQVEYAKPRFDEKFSDLKAEKIKYDLTGVVKNSPWLTGTRTEIAASCSMVADRTQGHTGIELSTEAKVKTNVLALVRQGCITALKNLKNPPEKFEGRIKANLRDGSQVTSLTELYRLILEGREIGSEILQDEIVKQKNYIQCLKTGTCGAGSSTPLHEMILWAEKYLAKKEALKLSYDRIQVTPLPSAQNIQSIRLESTDGLGFAKSARLEFELKLAVGILETEQVTAQLKGFAMLSQSDLDELRVNLDRILYGLQSGDLETKEDTFRTFRDGLFEFKRVINSDWPRN